MALPWPFREPTGSQHAARYEGKEIKENTKRNALSAPPPIFPTFTHGAKGARPVRATSDPKGGRPVVKEGRRRTAR